MKIKSVKVEKSKPNTEAVKVEALTPVKVEAWIRSSLKIESGEQLTK